LSATPRETMGLVPSHGSVSKTRATLRTVWWFSSQGFEKVGRNGPRLRAPSCWDSEFLRRMEGENMRQSWQSWATGSASPSEPITWRTVGPAGQETRPHTGAMNGTFHWLPSSDGSSLPNTTRTMRAEMFDSYPPVRVGPFQRAVQTGGSATATRLAQSVASRRP